MQNLKLNVTPHAIRHSHCSVLLSEGVSINYVSKRPGPASIAITQQVYAHLLEDKHTIDLLNTL
ncbi:tyrosine-type recombinase/integrase [Salinicoccus sediminis]|uniref:tyrosine-type recombinase/integrase n=1 Tax=Salinicoccus sediminis TaxID=1432562 RepID=UPI0009E4E563|nr:tyrosine-type recombinase/integrase [Salinicoccus sediminis]